MPQWRLHHEELTLLGQFGTQLVLAAGAAGTAAGALILRVRKGGPKRK